MEQPGIISSGYHGYTHYSLLITHYSLLITHCMNVGVSIKSWGVSAIKG